MSREGASREGASREVDQVRTANDLQKQNHLITECLNVQLIQNKRMAIEIPITVTTSMI